MFMDYCKYINIWDDVVLQICVDTVKHEQPDADNVCTTASFVRVTVQNLKNNGSTSFTYGIKVDKPITTLICSLNMLGSTSRVVHIF